MSQRMKAPFFYNFLTDNNKRLYFNQGLTSIPQCLTNRVKDKD